MLDREVFSEEIEKIQEIAKSYSLNGLEDDIKKLIDEIMSFDMKILFVGHFNAGKSSLINSLIGRSGFLEEDQIPTTAFAAELNYSLEEYADVIDKNNFATKYPIDKIKTKSNISHIAYHINSEVLKQLNDFTVVDTPGFDSGIESHTKALDSYLAYGSCFVLVISIEKGGIDSNTFSYIKEILNYSNDLVVLLNKTDKIPVSDADNIKSYVESSLELENIDCRVYCVSKFDENISQKLIDILNEFNAQYSFNHQSAKLISMRLTSMEVVLRSFYKSIEDPDTYSLDKEIANLKYAYSDMKETFEREKMKAEENIPEKVEQVKLSISNTLESKTDDMANAYFNGGLSALQAVITESVRPILMHSIKNFTGDIISNVIFDVKDSFKIDEEASESIGELIVNIASNTKDLIDQGVFSKSQQDGEKEAAMDGKRLYQVVTGILAIVTDVISPLLEVFIVLLPDILKIVGHFLGQTPSEKFKEIYRTAIVPQIVSRLHEDIYEAFEKSDVLLMEHLENETSSQLKFIYDTIEELQNKKSCLLQEKKEFEIKLQEHFSEIDDIKNKIERWL